MRVVAPVHASLSTIAFTHAQKKKARAIKSRKSENVKIELIGDESDKINGTFWDRKFEGPKSTVNGFIAGTCIK